MTVSNKVMPKEDRRIAILRFLDETDSAMPPKTIHVNIRRRGGTFSLQTVKRLLYELREEDLVQTLNEPDYYYVITEEGREYLQDID